MRYEILEDGDAPQSAPLTNKNALIQALLPALRQVESGGNDYAVSPAGAKGPYQFMDATAADVANQLGMADYNIFDNKDAEPMARHYLGTLYDRYKDPELALAAYNYGMGNVDKRLKNAPERSFSAIADSLPKETRNYVPKVMGLIGEALVPSVQAEEPSQVVKPNFGKYEILEDGDILTPSPSEQKPKYEILEDGDVPTEAPQPGYSLQDAAAEVMDYVPFGKKLAAGMSYLGSGMQEGQYEYAKQKLDENAQRFRDNAGGLAKTGAFATAALAQAPVAIGSSLVRALGMGALLGAGDSLDDAEFGKDAMIKGATGATIGAGAGALGYVAPKVISYASKAKIPFVGRSVQDIITGREGQSAGEKLLQNRLVNYSDEDLNSAIKNLTEAKAENSPTFLTEAIDKPEFTAQAKAIARKDNTAEIARTALKERQAGQYDRISEIADNISPIRSSDEATDLVVSRAKAIEEGLKKARTDATEPMYSQAYKETPTIQGIDDLLSVPSIQKAIGASTQDVNTVNLPENSTKLLNSVAAKLGDDVGVLKKSGKYQMARNRMETRVALKNVLDNIKPLKMANEEYANLSIPINKLKKAGFDKILKDEYGETVAKEGFTASQLGQQLLSERTKIADVRKLKEAFGGDDEPIKAAVRSHIQDLFDKRIDGNDISNILNTPKFKKKLNVLIGEDDATKLVKRLDREIKISQTNKELRVGSDPAGNLEQGLKEELKRLNLLQAVGAHPLKLMGKFVSKAGDAIGAPKPQIFQDEARIIFSRDPAQDALNSILSRRATDQRLAPEYQSLAETLFRLGVPTATDKGNSFLDRKN